MELLEAAELIEYDRKEEYIRIADWFYSSNITVSEKTVRGAARDFLKRGVPRIELVSRSIAEFVVGSLLGVKAYREKSTHGPVVIAELKDFLVEATLSFPNLENCLYREMVRRGAAVKAAYGDVFLGVVQGEALEQRQIDSTEEIGSTGGLEAPSKHNTKPYLTQNQIYTEPAARETGNEQPDQEKNLLGPMQSTLDSALVQVSKKKKTRC